jgi:flavin reductase (DIM6/NTAB) family NADH-FMN oxidoreductase RutF
LRDVLYDTFVAAISAAMSEDEWMKALARSDDFRDAMRLTASGVAALTTDGVAGRAGVTVSTFQSFSMEPPSVLACIHCESRNLEAILKNGIFAANVLAADQEDMARIFAGGTPERRTQALATDRWHVLATGAPVLRGALCSFDCRLADVFAFASHRIIIGAVEAIEIAGSEPLLYSDRAYRQLKTPDRLDFRLVKGELITPA